MADTSSLITIEQGVTDFLLGYKKSTDDYVIYLKHACDLLTRFKVYHSPEFATEKVSIDANGIIEMPTSMIGFKDLGIWRNGEMWEFTERPAMVNTTTTTGGVEGQDSDFGEGVAPMDNVTTGYGAKGAVNTYYYMLDWKARRIFCHGIISDTAVLRYTSSGIDATGTTYIPIILVPMLENYLLWKETYWIADLKRERGDRERTFINEQIQVRNFLNSLTAGQFRDIMWGTSTQTPRR